MSFRDRFYTPQVARAMTSPSGIVAGGAGAAIGVLVGLGPIGAVIGAIIAWVLRVGVAVPRRQRAASTRIDPFSLGDRWNRLVRDAQQAQHSFDRAMRSTPAGPLRERLDEIRTHLAEGVVEVWEIAKAGDAVESGRSQINRPAVERELAEIRALRSTDDAASLAATEEALLMQLATADRMDATVRNSESRLRLLNARLDEAVTRAVELSVSQADSTSTGALRADVAGIVDEMEALRQAMVEVRTVDATVPKEIPDLGTPAPPSAAPGETWPPSGGGEGHGDDGTTASGA